MAAGPTRNESLENGSAWRASPVIAWDHGRTAATHYGGGSLATRPAQRSSWARLGAGSIGG